MKNIAFIIGNNDYLHWDKLQNAVSDAEDMSSLFKRLGYDVHDFYNIGYDDLSKQLSIYEEIIREYDNNIFFFAGHGFEYQGENYLVPIDCPYEGLPYYLASKSQPLGMILDFFKRSDSTLSNIVILDACRKQDRGAAQGVQSVVAPKGTLIAFSTAPGLGASDKGTNGRNSVYTENLLNFIERENLPVEQVFKKVRQVVYALTKGRQTPWEHSSLIYDFYFNLGQLIESLDIPYSSEVVKDKMFQYTESEISKIVNGLKSYNYYTQNYWLRYFFNKNPSDFNKNELFLIGRNILQCADGNAQVALSFLNKVDIEVVNYSNKDGTNDLLNGILFEMYFNSSGDFRKNRLKGNSIWQEIVSLRNDKRFRSSFQFIQNCLSKCGDEVIYIPDEKNEIIDFVIDGKVEQFRPTVRSDIFAPFLRITSINFNGKDILKNHREKFSVFSFPRMNGVSLKNYFSSLFHIPETLIKITPETVLSQIVMIEGSENAD